MQPSLKRSTHRLKQLCMLKLYMLFCLEAAMSEQLLTSSLLLRHCVRAPGPALKNPLPNVSADPNDFSSLPWPSFPAKPDHCVPLGIELLERQAISLAESLPPGRVRIVSDVFNRTIVTAKALCRVLANYRCSSVRSNWCRGVQTSCGGCGCRCDACSIC